MILWDFIPGTGTGTRTGTGTGTGTIMINELYGVDIGLYGPDGPHYNI